MDVSRRKLPPNPRYPAKLQSMPMEILTQIVSHLSPIDSACLGVTSKVLYAAHFRRHNKVALTEQLQTHELACGKCPWIICKMQVHISDWMPKGLRYCWKCNRFSTWVMVKDDVLADGAGCKRCPCNGFLAGVRYHLRVLTAEQLQDWCLLMEVKERKRGGGLLWDGDS